MAIDEVQIVLLLVLCNDLAIGFLFWRTRKATSKAAKTSNIIPDMTSEQEAAAKWWLNGQMESLVKDYRKWQADQVWNR